MSNRLNNEMASNTELEETFKHAADYIAQANLSLSNEKMLELYGFYKQATVGPCNIPEPGFLEFTAKSKWKRWNSLGQMAIEEAMRNYVTTVDAIKPGWEEETVDPKKKTCFGISVSKLYSSEDYIEKTLYDYAKEGNLDDLKKELNDEEINQKDLMGLGLIHWAADGGHANVVEYLLQHGADINLTDKEGQTALHYGSSCGYADVVHKLLTWKADTAVADNDGLLPKDVALDKDIASVFESFQSS